MVDTGGAVTIAFGGSELSVTPMIALIILVAAFVAMMILLKLAGLLMAVLHFVNGDNTALSRYFDRNREKRGYDALGESIIALASGDGKQALNKAARAEKLLDRPEVTQLLTAQAAQMSGDKTKAKEHFKALLSHESTRFVGVKGLMQQKLDEGDTDTALKLAQKAFAINPRHDPTLETLFALQSDKKDWEGAKKTLQARIHTQALPKDVGRRRDAVLMLASAVQNSDDTDSGQSAIDANRIAPGLIPAAIMAARAYIARGEARKAAGLLKKAWTQNPHPEIASVFAEIAPDETPEARIKRFRALLKLKPEDTETKLLEAELFLAAEDFPAASKAIGSLAETDSTARSLTIMAAIERGMGASEAEISGWLARALSAPRGDAWVCDNCHHIHGKWEPICENCSSFDTLAWVRVPANEDVQTMAAAMLPLLMRSEPEPEETIINAAPENGDAPSDDDSPGETTQSDAK